jgi:hypothetical protein
MIIEPEGKAAIKILVIACAIPILIYTFNKVGFITVCAYKQAGWFRLGRTGLGLQWKGPDCPMLFSERNGYEKYWRFKLLEAQ